MIYLYFASREKRKTGRRHRERGKIEEGVRGGSEMKFSPYSRPIPYYILGDVL